MPVENISFIVVLCGIGSCILLRFSRTCCWVSSGWPHPLQPLPDVSIHGYLASYLPEKPHYLGRFGPCMMTCQYP